MKHKRLDKDEALRMQAASKKKFFTFCFKQDIKTESTSNKK